MLHAVACHDQAFQPAELTIHAGDIVEWECFSQRNHIIVLKLPDDGPTIEGAMICPGVEPHKDRAKFSKPGVYPYYDKKKPEVQGTITVEG